MQKFDASVRKTMMEIVSSVVIPGAATVFDYFYDNKRNLFVNWSERHLEKLKNIESNYVVVPEVFDVQLFCIVVLEVFA